MRPCIHAGQCSVQIKLTGMAAALAVVAALLAPAIVAQGEALANISTFTVPVCLQVAYQGHGASGTSRWMLPVTTIVYAASTSDVIAAWRQTTDASGGYCAEITTASSPMVVDIQVKHSHTLSNKKLAVTLPGPGAYINMGTLLEGDANSDDRVNITDFSILRTTYGQACPSCDGRANFNADGQISIADFSLLRTNYGQSGPIMVSPPLTPAQQATMQIAGGGTLTLARGSTVVPQGTVTALLDVLLQAGEQPVDGVDMLLNFDPTTCSSPMPTEPSPTP